jgi:serine/threonine protein kinase
MAEVYGAISRQTGNPVAIKVLTNVRAGDQGQIGRFINEFKCMAGLEHPDILPVYGRGSYTIGAYSYPFIVMPLVIFKSLAEVFKETPLTVEKALKVIRRIAEVVASLHARGIAHRDLKPGNIFYDPDTDCLLVADFGLAKSEEKAGGGSDHSKTRGMNIGTPAYLHPACTVENRKPQHEPRNFAVYKAADLYALGVMFYYFLTGHTQLWNKNNQNVVSFDHWDIKTHDLTTVVQRITKITEIDVEELYVDFKRFTNFQTSGDVQSAENLRQNWQLIFDFHQLSDLPGLHCQAIAEPLQNLISRAVGCGVSGSPKSFADINEFIAEFDRCGLEELANCVVTDTAPESATKVRPTPWHWRNWAASFLFGAVVGGTAIGVLAGEHNNNPVVTEPNPATGAGSALPPPPPPLPPPPQPINPPVIIPTTNTTVDAGAIISPAINILGRSSPQPVRPHRPHRPRNPIPEPGPTNPVITTGRDPNNE